MNSIIARSHGITLATASLVVLLTLSTTSAARCQISNVSYTYPQTAVPSQQIEVDTRVVGSCVSTGYEYYSLRVDLVDANSSSIISSSSTPIGYSANNFTVTAQNHATAPPFNATWPIQIHVYVIRAGGTSGEYLLDYSTVGNATIQVGATSVPEFYLGTSFVVIASLAAAALIISGSNHRRRTPTLLLCRDFQKNERRRPMRVLDAFPLKDP